MSLSSEMMRTHENENTSGIGEISGLTTDLETTSGQTRQLDEDTIDLSQDQEWPFDETKLFGMIIK